MLSLSRLKGVARPLIALAALVVSTGAAQAQSQAAATITGTITNEAGTPIPGANILLPQLNTGTTAGTNGKYTVSLVGADVIGKSYVITARYIGFSPVNKTVTIQSGSQVVDFTLKADPFRLSEVVVTGVTEATSTRMLSFSVAKVSADQVDQVPAVSPVAALAGKVSGARIELGTGNPGAAPTIRLRGSTNLGLGTSAPLIIVDGVITKSSLADFDANDIETIEVLKGAAAASFYGSDAANGVVQIITKRGKFGQEGRVQFSVRSEGGQSNIGHYPSMASHHEYDTNADGSFKLDAAGARIVKQTTGVGGVNTSGIMDQAYPAGSYRNQMELWLKNGNFYTTNAQLGLRRGNTNFNSSFTFDRNEGILPFVRGQDRRNLRLNLDQALAKNLDMSAGISYGLNTNDLGGEESGPFFALLQAPPDIDLKYPSGQRDVLYWPKLPDSLAKNARGNPLYALANQDYTIRRERMLGSFAVRYRPTDWLRVEASYGTDRSNRRNRNYQFRGYLNGDGEETKGALSMASWNDIAENSQLNATATKLLFSNLLTSTRVAYLYENVENVYEYAGGNALKVTGTPDLAGLDPTLLSVNSELENIRTKDLIASQSLTWKDRYILDILGRRDGSSLFGSDQRWQNFYRISGAYRISEDFRIPGVQEMKIRAARGTAGLRPSFYDQYETYSLSGGVFSKQQVGNKNLKPAIQTEDEFGLNITFLNRFDLELVQANRVTRGAFLNVPLSVSAGGFSSQVQNAADVSARTTELSLQTRVIDKPNFSYSFSLTGDHTTQRIDAMSVAPFKPSFGGALGQGQAIFYYRAGEPLGVIYGTKWVRSIAQLHDNPANAGINDADYTINADGYVVKKSTQGTAGEQPIAYIDAKGNKEHVIGNVNPDFNFGFANNVSWKNITLYALFTGVKGGEIYNFTKQWGFQDQRPADLDQSGRPAAQRIPVAFYTVGLYNALNPSSHFVESGSYMKLKELSLGYALGQRTLDKVGLTRYVHGAKLAVIGRNLYTWTKYSGFDPEVTAGSDFNFRIDGFRYPAFRQITGQVTLNF